MKKIVTALSLLAISLSSFAQLEKGEEDMKGKFRQDNIFIGGSIGLSIGGGYGGGFQVGGNPEVGYTIANWLDAGISGNINYFSSKAENNYGERLRSTTTGGGAFVRIHPIRNVFLQAQPEYNWITTKVRNYNYNPAIDTKYKQEAPSLLLGVGYGTRVVGASSFFTVLMFDVGNNLASPYITADHSRLPILRSGFTVYLKPKKQK